MFGIILFTGPIFGKIAAVVAILNAFSTLSENPGATPDVLANDIDSGLIAIGIGIAVGIVGAALIYVAMFVLKNRETWFFWSGLLLSIAWCIVILPIGLAVGIPFVSMFAIKRPEFRKRRRSSR